MRRALLVGFVGAGSVVVLFVVVAILLAKGKSDPAKVAAERTPTQSQCAKALLKDWADGRIDASYRLECYRAALTSLPVDLRVYSRAPEDISQALSQRIVQGSRKGSQK
jgi:hypothetical protein